MCNQSEWVVREAFLAYARGDVSRMMEYVDPDVRCELEQALRLRASHGLQPEVEEVIASGEQVMLVMRTAGFDHSLELPAGDRTYDVVTVRDGLIVGLRECHDRIAARSLIGIG